MRLSINQLYLSKRSSSLLIIASIHIYNINLYLPFLAHSFSFLYCPLGSFTTSCTESNIPGKAQEAHAALHTHTCGAVK